MRLEIPIVGGAENAHQFFEVQLGDNFLTIYLDYFPIAGYWLMGIELDGERLVDSAALSTGADVIKPWRLSEKLGYFYFVGETATLDNLGIDNNLVWSANE